MGREPTAAGKGMAGAQLRAVKGSGTNSDTCVCVGGGVPSPSNAGTPVGHTTIQLNSNTICLETSDPTG